ncbi:MAG: hypothetical protein WBE92_09420, partial [Steroidobacteraceae bacterium]
HLVSEEVAEAIVRFVAGGAELANAEVEPSLLSLICRELNEQRIAQNRSEISQDLLAGSHETILSNFYERSLSDQPESVRRIIEDDLLTESGYRENLSEESLLKRFQAAGAAPDGLAKLVNRRLLRIEERLDVRRVELTHDVLTGVVKASRDQRHQREAREATERALAEQRERENAARRALHRARAIAVGCTALALVAFAAAIFALVSFQRAQRAELIARQTRAVSEQARQQAEGLLGFLTDSFVRELETFGREQTIAELSQREIDYFRRLPAALQDPQTVRSGATALVNHANALVLLGDLSAGADKDSTEAIALLESLRRTNPSDATTIVLANAYGMRISIFVVQGNMAAANISAARALELLRPLAERRDASLEARRAYVEALSASAFLRGSFTGPYEEAVRDAREAQRLALQLGARRAGDVTLDADYAYAGVGLGAGLFNLGRDDEALRAVQDSLTVADQVLAQRPQYGTALIAKQFIELDASAAAWDELDLAEAVRLGLQSEQTSLALMQVEPQNGDYLNNLAEAERVVSAEMWGAGRLRDSITYAHKSLDAFGRASQGGARPLALMYAVGVAADAASRQAQLGDVAEAAKTLAAADAVLTPSALRRLGPVGGSVSEVINAVRAYPAAALAYQHDDFGSARRVARAALAALHTQELFGQVSRYALSDLNGRAEYQLGDFAAAAQAERTALQAFKIVSGNDVSDRRDMAQVSTWLSMALAREGKREEATQTIAPVVTMYRALEKKNHGDQWLPLEFAEALYAQSLTDDRHRAELLREAAQRVDHLIPSIAALHDPRQWRARIEAARRRRGAP